MKLGARVAGYSMQRLRLRADLLVGRSRSQGSWMQSLGVSSVPGLLVKLAGSWGSWLHGLRTREAGADLLVGG